MHIRPAEQPTLHHEDVETPDVAVETRLDHGPGVAAMTRSR